MTSSFARRVCAVTATAALGLTGIASAKAGDRTFAQTYPYASALCAKAGAGTLPRRLRASAAQVQAACNTLQSGFGPLQSAVAQAQTTFQAGVAADRAKVQAACRPRTPSCRSTRIEVRADLRNLRAAHRLAVRTYYVGVESNRRTFWATIRSLRGGRSVKSDQPIPVQSS